jgi:hypothetical protein
MRQREFVTGLGAWRRGHALRGRSTGDRWSDFSVGEAA